MKVEIITYEIRKNTVELPTMCPGCDARLTERASLNEYQLCEGVAGAHLDGEYVEEDSATQELEIMGVLAYKCAECGLILAGDTEEV